MSGAFLGVVLTVVVAGPAPAVLVGVLTMIENARRRRLGPDSWLTNLSCHAAFPLVGALLFQLVDGPQLLAAREIVFVPVVVGVFMTMNLVNFVLVAVDVGPPEGRGLREAVRDVYVPVFPVELACSVLTAIVAYAYVAYGAGALMFLGVVALSFQHLIGMATDAVRSKAEVEARNEQLATLQVGLISTTLKTLSLRDHNTARHSAAVARYSREMAAELDLDTREQDVIHTAALFHDIGKFIFPDSILLTDRRLNDDEYEIVKRHPVVGAELIAEIDGYGPVADIVRSHHERIDGRGYPDGLAGDDIPLGARIVAVADIYDVITARDTYRTPVSVPEAFAELRRVAGTQLDAALVELFIDLVERRGIRFRHTSEADFEAELALERRVREYAEPRPTAA